MKKKIYISIFTALVLILCTACGNKALKDDYGCFVNYEDALSYAGKKKLPMLIFFTSQGDDELSTQIAADIFKGSEFSSILKHYSVFHADFSKEAFSKTAGDDSTYTTIMQNNYQLAMLFNVDEMPAVFLTTKDGYVVSRLDTDYEYDALTMAEFQSILSESKEDLENFNKLVSATTKGSAVSKVEAIDALYVATEAEYKIFLLPLIKKGIELDKNNESGLAGKLLMAEAEAEALTAYSQGEVDLAIQGYLKAANSEYVKAEEKQECFYTAAYLAAFGGSEDYQGILSYLQTAYELAPDSDKAPAIQEAISYYKIVLEKIEGYDSQKEVDAK